jgi:hypothetical protein
MLPRILIEILECLDELKIEYTELGKKGGGKASSVIGLYVTRRVRRKVTDLIKKKYDRGKTKKRRLTGVRVKATKEKVGKNPHSGKRP